MTKAGLLVSSVSRRDPTDLDTDIVTGMLTVIMDFAGRSFSDERERHLEGLTLGDERAVIVRGELAFLAVVYKGRTPGSLSWIMRSLLEHIERSHGDALGDIVDTSRLEEIPSLLRRLVLWGWWPFLRFGSEDRRAPPVRPSNSS